jgi:hypothetical protein
VTDEPQSPGDEAEVARLVAPSPLVREGHPKTGAKSALVDRSDDLAVTPCDLALITECPITIFDRRRHKCR